MFAILSRIELMFQVITRSATAHPTCWGWEIEPRIRRRSEQPGQPELKDRARKKQRRPVGGETGRLHVRSVWGKQGPQGIRARSEESLASLRFRLREMGSYPVKTMPRFPHARSSENACCAREPTVIPSCRVNRRDNARTGCAARCSKGREQSARE